MNVPILRGYVSSRYGQMHYREVAAPAGGGGRPLVLLHQNPASSFEYEPLMREMGRDRRVIALDTPGYGMSDGPSQPLSIADYVESFADALPRLGIEPGRGCDAYGFHTGALHVIELALALPENVRRIALTGLPMRSEAERAERLAIAQAAPALDEAGTVALEQARKLWDYVVASRAAGVSLASAAANWIDKLRPLDRAQWAYHGVWSYDFAGRLPLVRQPALLIQPHEEIVQQSIAAIRLIPDHHIVEMPQFSRDILDLPPAVTRIAMELRRFLDENPA